jgi:hypothetical protein
MSGIDLTSQRFLAFCNFNIRTIMKGAHHFLVGALLFSMSDFLIHRRDVSLVDGEI